MKIHIAIVSDQTLANLIPILMERPDKVYLVCSEVMEDRGLASRIRALVERESISVETKTGAPNAVLRSIHQYAVSLAAEIQRDHPGAEIILNATGGTKLMSLGFVEAFRDFARGIIYTDTSHRRIEIFPDSSGAAVSPIEMRNVMDVPGYLAAQGFSYVKARSDDAAWRRGAASCRAACMYLGKHVWATQVQTFIGKMNALADKALGTDSTILREPRQSFNGIPRGEWERALAEIARAGLVRWRKGTSVIQFTDVGSAIFLRGGWLEEYAWHVVKDQGAHDVRCSVEVTGDGMPHACNEFDLLACHGNELLVIECKTLRYHDENDSQIAYKSDSLGKQARGQFGETWLLSARAPTDTLMERARQARIRIIGPAELPRLQLIIRDWILGSK